MENKITKDGPGSKRAENTSEPKVIDNDAKIIRPGEDEVEADHPATGAGTEDRTRQTD